MGEPSSDEEQNSYETDKPINDIDKAQCASLLLTNARSLLPKMGALKDAFDSLELHCACVTEMWFRAGKDLNRTQENFEGEHGISIIHCSRDGRSKKAAGGVAIAFRTSACNLRRRHLKNRREGQELLCVTGRIAGVPRKVAVFVCYVPPDMRAAKFGELCDTLAAEVAAVKMALGDPVIFVTGDFNHRDVGPTLSLAANLCLTPQGLPGA